MGDPIWSNSQYRQWFTVLTNALETLEQDLRGKSPAVGGDRPSLRSTHQDGRAVEETGPRDYRKQRPLILSGNLGYLDAAFEGWTCRGGCLVSPEGWMVPIDEVRAVPFLRQQLAVFRAENRRIKGMEKQPASVVPDDNFGQTILGLSDAMSPQPASNRELSIRRLF